MNNAQGEEVARPAGSVRRELEGVVLPDGRWQCLLRDRHGEPTEAPCNSVMADETRSKSSHMSKMHKAGSSYQEAQESKALLVCDRPPGPGQSITWCLLTFKNLHGLRAHASHVHGYKGKTSHLEKSFVDLQLHQRLFLVEKHLLESTRNEDRTFDSQTDQERYQELANAKFPDEI